MNLIHAKIQNILSEQSLSITQLDFAGHTLKMMSLSLSELKSGDKVILSVKPTNVAIGKSFFGNVSYSNQFRAKIIKIDNGKLLSSIKLEFEKSIIESIITLDSAKKMDLKVDDEVTIFIKASDLFINEVIND